jgi:hypothetical protein
VFASSQRRHRVDVEVNYASNVPHSADFGTSVWQKTPSYSFMRSVTHLSDFHALPLEGGQLRLLYDDKYLYAAADVHDSDVTTDGTRNQTHLYAQGDVIEVFLKENSDFYEEKEYITLDSFKSKFGCTFVQGISGTDGFYICKLRRRK